MTFAVDVSALGPWTPPDPRDLPQWRARLRDHMLAPDTLLGLAAAINSGRAVVLPVMPGVDASPGAVAAQILARLEHQRLNDAALYYVTADMTALALAAAQTPPGEPVTERRLPTPAGLMVFASPIGGYRQDVRDVLGSMGMQVTDTPIEVSTPIVAVSWSTWSPDAVHVTDTPGALTWVHHGSDDTVSLIGEEYAGIWLTFYSGGDSVFAALPPQTVLATTPTGAVTAGDMAEKHRRQPLVWDNETLLTRGVGFGPAEADSTMQWAHVVYTAWQLITQQGKTVLADLEAVPRDRAGRRRDARTGITGPSEVRIVHVHAAHRPPASAARQDEEASSGRHAPQWSCRWPVRPYRRNTCLNPRAHADGGCEHEDRIVPAHIKGPASKPLRVTETVNLWDSQPET
ncbi:hypothetical protein GCM10018953_59220 [Streptosporangium nondiastaticum]|uniref:hypothetical protein n=1 Tax=Streptosporangium TaxID=2000 RepID=UPI0031F93CD5